MPRDPEADSGTPGQRRNTLVLRLHHALNLLTGLVWFFVLIEFLSPVRIPIADYGSPIGMLVLFFAIPIGLVTLFWLDRRRSAPLTSRRRAYFIASRLFLTLSWIPSWLPALFLIAIYQPWPLTLLEGPDTDFARAGFEQICGREPPASVSGVYYRVRGPRDPVIYLRCEGVDRALLEHVVARLKLEAVGEPRAAGDYPSWWPSDESRGFDRVFTRADGWEALWYRERDGLLLYLHVTF